MANPSKRKGTAHENGVVEALQTRWPRVERRVQRGIHDAGDIAGTPYTVECKAERKVDLAGWWREAQRESQENGNRPPIVIAKRKGTQEPMDQWVLMDVRTFLRIIPQRKGRCGS